MTRRAAELKSLAQDRIEDILHRLAPGGRHNRGHYLVSNPMRRDRTPSLCIWTRGDAAGGFKDFGDPDETKGDIFGLVAYLNGHAINDFTFASAWLHDFLGIARLSAEERREAAAARARRRQENDEAAERKKRRGHARANELWRGGRLIGPGTPAYAYLLSRGIDLLKVPNYSGELRWLRSAEYWMGAEWGERLERGRRVPVKVRPGPSFPAIITPLRTAEGGLRALHYTFLALDGSGKADVEKPKLIYPEQTGLSMWLTHGPSGMDPCAADAAGVTGPLGITEGMEDGLSLALGGEELRIWGAVSLPNLAHQPVGRPCVSAVLIAAQNDWGKPQALATLTRAEAALARHGKPMGRIAAFTGKDLNDTLQGKD